MDRIVIAEHSIHSSLMTVGKKKENRFLLQFRDGSLAANIGPNEDGSEDLTEGFIPHRSFGIYASHTFFFGLWLEIYMLTVLIFIGQTDVRS